MWIVWVGSSIINFILFLIIYKFRPNIVKEIIFIFYNPVIFFIHIFIFTFLALKSNYQGFFVIFINLLYVFLVYDFFKFVIKKMLDDVDISDISKVDNKKIEKVFETIIKNLKLQDIIHYLAFSILYIQFLITLIIY